MNSAVPVFAPFAEHYPDFQPLHLIVILLIAIVVFGPKKLPDLGKGLGEGIRGFKKAMNDIHSDREADAHADKK